MGRAGAVVSTGTDADTLFKRRKFSLPPGGGVEERRLLVHTHTTVSLVFFAVSDFAKQAFNECVICSADPSSHKQRSSALPLASWGLSPRAFHFYTPALVPG